MVEPTSLDAAQLLFDGVEAAIAAPPRDRAVSLKVARHVLSHWGDEHLGQDGGTFVNRLIRLLLSADETNAAKLAAADPVWAEYVTAVDALYRKSWGPEWLRKIAREGDA